MRSSLNTLILIAFFSSIYISCTGQTAAEDDKQIEEKSTQSLNWDGEKIDRTDQEWKSLLTPQAYNILREQGTERAFTGTYWDNKEAGIYTCAGCGLALFDSRTKFKSGTGWPSYFQPIAANHVGEERDDKYGWNRVEVHCNRCDGHLGHIFEDGPKPTGLRYCINSASLNFIADKAEE